MTTVIRIKGGERGLMKPARKVSVSSFASEIDRKSILGKDSSERNPLGCQEETVEKKKERCADSLCWTLQAQDLTVLLLGVVKLKHNI